MKIATWNLESVRPLTKDRLEVFQSTMRVVNPDVWILTETWEDFTPGDKYQRVAVSRSAGDLKNSLGRCWVAIWAKLDLSAESLDNHGQKDRMACAICTKPGQTRVVVVGTVPALA
jgi:exonuclease III